MKRVASVSSSTRSVPLGSFSPSELQRLGAPSGPTKPMRIGRWNGSFSGWPGVGGVAWPISSV